MKRGLAAQESGAEHAKTLGVPMAAKRWPASGGYAAIDRELALAEAADVRLIVGWMWHNDAGNATPGTWPKLSTFGPNYANAGMRGLALQSIRDLGTRYDGHPQIEAIMANVGLDGERRFAKSPQAGQPAYDAYIMAGLTVRMWQQFVADVARVYAESFTKTQVLFHYSGFGFGASEIGRDADVATAAGLGLMSSGLYPIMCSGNSYGGKCNPLTPLMNDWQVPSMHTASLLAMEQSLPYSPDQAALSWLWAVAHGARQIHSQRGTLEMSAGKEWRATVEGMLEDPSAALWVAMDPTKALCEGIGRPFYCPEVGNWSRNVLQATYGASVYNVGADYRGWSCRMGPVTLRTKVEGPAEVVVHFGDGSVRGWVQDSGATVNVPEAKPVHRVEVWPQPAAPPPPEPPEPPTPPATTRAWHVVGVIDDRVVDFWIERPAAE